METERPITRWRRDGRPEPRAQGDDRERPKSRRGTSLYSDTTARARTPSSRLMSSFAPTPTSKMANDKVAGSLLLQRERLVSEQGLNVARTATTSQSQGVRLIQDKRYFQGALQLKVGQITKELSNMHKEMDQIIKEQASFAVYDRRVKQMASELTEMQGILADHNMAIDKVNTGSDVHRMNQEAAELAANNDSEVATLELLYSDRMRRQEVIRELEDHITKEKHRAELLISEMGSTLREQYNELKNQNNDYSTKVSILRAEINSLMKTKSLVGDQVYVSPGKTEYVQLELKMWELEKKRDALREGLLNTSSPEKQRSDLLNKLKQDNAQIATMKKSINEMQEQIRQAEMALEQSHQISDEGENIRHAKYIELSKKEEAIEEFLSSVEDMKKEELYKLQGMGNEIVPLLKSIGAKIAVVPTAADYRALQSPSVGILPSSEVLNTAKSIGNEHKNLSRYLSKVEVMSFKVESELNSLSNKMDMMRSQLITFSNTVDLEGQIDSKRVALLSEKAQLEVMRPKTKLELKQRNNQFNEIQRALVDNEEYAQLLYIEKKLAGIEQSNFAIRDYLDEAKSEENIELSRSKALNSVKKLNIIIRNAVK